MLQNIRLAGNKFYVYFVRKLFHEFHINQCLCYILSYFINPNFTTITLTHFLRNPCRFSRFHRSLLTTELSIIEITNIDFNGARR